MRGFTIQCNLGKILETPPLGGGGGGEGGQGTHNIFSGGSLPPSQSWKPLPYFRPKIYDFPYPTLDLILKT